MIKSLWMAADCNLVSLRICMSTHDQCVYVCDRENFSIRKAIIQGSVLHLFPFTTVDTWNNDGLSLLLFSYHKDNAIRGVSIYTGSKHVGNSDGIGTAASFDRLMGIAIDHQTRTSFVCGTKYHMIRRIANNGEVSTLVGSLEGGFADGEAAKFYLPRGVCYDSSCQSLIVCGYANNRLRRVQLNGDATTLCTVAEPACVVITASKTILVSSPSQRFTGPESYGVVPCRIWEGRESGWRS